MENQFLNIIDSAPLSSIIGEIALTGISYTLDDPSGNFAVNPTTGDISLVNQITDDSSFTVTVTDSDNNSTVVNVTVRVFPSAIVGDDNNNQFDSAFGDNSFIGLAQSLLTFAGNDIVDVSVAGAGNFINTGRGNDTIFTGTDNEINLDEGDDRIFAGSGNGGNIITGGVGADQFWLVTDENAIPTNLNTVTDFNPTEDVIGFASTSFNLDNKGDSWDYRRVDGDVIISAFGQDIAVLFDTTITDGNFVFGANIPVLPDVVTVNFAVTPQVGTEEDETVFSFTVTADNPVTGNQNLSLLLTGTAEGADFIDAIPTTVTIADGETSASFTLQVFDDSLVEGTETVTFTLANPSQGVVIGNNADVTVTIEDNDQVIPDNVINLSVSPFVGGEGEETVFTFTVTADSAVTGNQTVDLSLTGTAEGADFIDSIPDTITIADGQSSASFTLQVFDDTLVEGTETGIFTLSNPSDGLVLGNTSSRSVNIEDNDNLLNTNIFRFRTGEGSYLYVGDEERQSILGNFNFIDEGFAFQVAQAPSADDELIPMYRFRNTTSISPTYIYVGEEERVTINDSFYEEEGVAFYVFGVEAERADDVFRFQTTSGGHIYVGNSERDSILNNFTDYNLEGVAFQADW